MIPAVTFAGATVAVFGLGASGVASCRALTAAGATVAAWDDGAATRASAEQAGISLVDLSDADWSVFRALVLAPGVPLTHPAPHWTVKRAADVGCPVIGDTELMFQARAAAERQPPIIAITGTNGKSTTTALTGHLLRTAGLTVGVGGNIGTAVMSLPPFAEVDTYVLEFSSYQIDLTPSLAPTVGVHLNVTPDHLDRHGTLERYAAIKQRLVTSADAAVIAVDDDHTCAASRACKAAGVPTVTVSTTGVSATIAPSEDVSASHFLIAASAVTGPPARFSVAASLALRGRHNMQNAMAAVAAVRAIGVTDDALIQRGLDTFGGLAHRMQPIARQGRVLFVNDSKATNAESTAQALAAYDADIHWIVGGRAKDGGIDGLTPLFGRLARAYLIGESVPDFAATLARAAPGVDVVDAGDIATAVARAAAGAGSSSAAQPVVLLSPAAASFDQFANFERRGDAFCAAVAALPDVTVFGEDAGQIAEPNAVGPTANPT
ncbi:MAG: UDP-N-acetylmuramoyl-L-alanine--D-glutamate ligase [Pseudomonadota bacterium]